MSDPNDNSAPTKKWLPSYHPLINQFCIFQNCRKDLKEDELKEAIKRFELTTMDYLLYFIRIHERVIPLEEISWWIDSLSAAEAAQIKKDLVTGKANQSNLINYAKYF